MARWLDADGKVYEAWGARRPTDREEVLIDLAADDELPENAIELIGWLTDRVGSAPLEYRATVEFKIECSGDYDGVCGHSVTLGYTRFETEDEVAVRLEADRKAREAQHAEDQRRERRQYEALKRKFEG